MMQNNWDIHMGKYGFNGDHQEAIFWDPYEALTKNTLLEQTTDNSDRTFVIL